MEDKSLSLWKIPLGISKKKNPHGFQFGETAMEFHKNNPRPERFEKELKIGMHVEKEHATDSIVTRKIAMDHLKEDPHYYTKLKKIFKNH